MHAAFPGLHIRVLAIQIGSCIKQLTAQRSANLKYSRQEQRLLLYICSLGSDRHDLFAQLRIHVLLLDLCLFVQVGGVQITGLPRFTGQMQHLDWLFAPGI